MKETRVYCDGCGTDLTDGYPGEDYTVVPVQEPVKRHHDPSEEVEREYHLCSEEVEPFEFRSSRFFRARDSIPMMLNARVAFHYDAREDFKKPFGEIADTLEGVWADE